MATATFERCDPMTGQTATIALAMTVTDVQDTADLKLSTIKTSEKVSHTAPQTGQTVITDRGYARVRDISTVLAQECQSASKRGSDSNSVQI